MTAAVSCSRRPPVRADCWLQVSSPSADWGLEFSVYAGRQLVDGSGLRVSGLGLDGEPSGRVLVLGFKTQDSGCTLLRLLYSLKPRVKKNKSL